ncbi:MAG: ATP-binding protein [Elusimicrobia bacterium]|nr:ATP-binding protein [Elusimicrobiota bacterium]
MHEGLLDKSQGYEALRRAYESQQALNGMLGIGVKSIPLADKLNLFLDYLLGVPWFRVEKKGAIFLLEDGELVMAAQRNMPPVLRRVCARVAVGRCLCGRAAGGGGIVVAAHLDERHEISYPEMADHGHVCAPIAGEEGVLGVLNLYTEPAAELDVQQREFVQAAAGVIAAAVVLARAEEKFIQCQKMEAMGRLASGVAHDFNNVLTVLMGYDFLLLEGLEPDSPLAAHARELRRGIGLAASVARQMLAFTRSRPARLRPLDVNSVVLESRKMLQRLLGEEVALEAGLCASVWPVRADAARLQQALLNLASNARDAMPAGGRFLVETENLEVGAGREPGLALEPGSYVRLSVSDTGGGMTEEVLRRACEPFFTTKRAGLGTGLGLATVKGIVRQAGGRLAILSRPGEGTAVRIYLPRAEGGAAALLPGRAEPEARGGSETIMIVEDHEDLRGLISDVLRGKGYRVLSAATPEAALRAPGPADLLVADLVLPRLSGPEVAGRLKARWPALRVLYMSGCSEPPVEAAAGSGFLEKPFSPTQLLVAVRQALDASPARRA